MQPKSNIMKALIFSTLVLATSFSVNAELIQHSEQIGEIKFTGSTYELGQHVGEVASEQILAGMQRFDTTLGVMLPGLSLSKLEQSFTDNKVFSKLKLASPDAAQYIAGLSASLDISPNRILAVGMSDEAILESQRSGGMGFLQAEGHQPAAPAKCTSFAVKAKGGKAWAASNFDYMGINYQGLLMLNHTDTDGGHRIIQTWAGLIPYGGVSKGGQVFLMNTMADEGTARQNAKGEILSETAVPSYYLSWDVYNTKTTAEVVKLFKKYPEYTAFFTYTVAGEGQVLNIENNYGGHVNFSYGDWQAHANHSLYQPKPEIVNASFAAKSVARQDAAENFMKKEATTASKADVQNFMGHSVLWKGRGELMGTVTSTFYEIDNGKVTLYFQTDHAGENEKTVVITYG
ncbi:hypothetical protein Ssed_1374 [Shewanella sediminis HAW-EB3]|uniref:Lipoprotein n=2 Tax=Shewanella sediminis TaxID=271097 RepID=A8FT12_SHESH|nr:hypothetical protein Ssed_1374 [Shewanella sediminis HAW-EB3]